VTWALDTGLVDAVEPLTEVWVDVPSGRLRVEAAVTGGRVRSVRFENVASYVTATDVAVRVGGRDLVVDVSYGGAFYASADAAQLGVRITPEHLPTLIEAGRSIKWEIDADDSTEHPVDARLGGCYGTIWYERLGVDADGTVRQRNVTIFADGEVDRSPCGSGTSARLALLDHRGELARGAHLSHESVIGSRFTGRVLGDGPPVGDRPTVRTEVGGRAHRTGSNVFTLDPEDDLGLGFQLR
jgi:proline racemase